MKQMICSVYIRWIMVCAMAVSVQSGVAFSSSTLPVDEPTVLYYLVEMHRQHGSPCSGGVRKKLPPINPSAGLQDMLSAMQKSGKTLESIMAERKFSGASIFFSSTGSGTAQQAFDQLKNEYCEAVMNPLYTHIGAMKHNGAWSIIMASREPGQALVLETPEVPSVEKKADDPRPAPSTTGAIIELDRLKGVPTIPGIDRAPESLSATPPQRSAVQMPRQTGPGVQATPLEDTRSPSTLAAINNTSVEIADPTMPSATDIGAAGQQPTDPSVGLVPSEQANAPAQAAATGMPSSAATPAESTGSDVSARVIMPVASGPKGKTSYVPAPAVPTPGVLPADVAQAVNSIQGGDLARPATRGGYTAGAEYSNVAPPVQLDPYMPVSGTQKANPYTSPYENRASDGLSSAIDAIQGGPMARPATKGGPVPHSGGVMPSAAVAGAAPIPQELVGAINAIQGGAAARPATKGPAIPVGGVATGVTAAQGAGLPTYYAESEAMLRLINDKRITGVLCGSRFMTAPALKGNPVLFSVATAHAMDMANRRYFSSISPEGVQAGKRLVQAGYHWSMVTENIASAHTPAAAVLQGWLANEAQCKTIMSSEYIEAGVGFAPTAGYWVLTLTVPAGAPR